MICSYILLHTLIPTCEYLCTYETEVYCKSISAGNLVHGGNYNIAVKQCGGV